MNSTSPHSRLRPTLLALTAALFAAPTFAQESGGGSEKVISISFANGRVNANLPEQILVSETDAAIGLVSVPGKYWSNVYQDGLTNSAKSINATSTVNTIYDVATGAPIAGAPTTSVTFSAANGWSILGKQANPTSPSILHAYLDDGASGAAVTIPIVPFDTYDVIVYFATDNAKQAKAGDGQEIADAPAMQFAPVTVNGTLYSWQDGALVSGEAATDVPFGQSMQDTVVEGTNALRIPNLSGSLTIRGGTPVKGDGRIKGRGGIAALQIIGQEVVSSETLKDGVVYYSTFENTAAQTFNDAREQGTGTIEGATTLPYERLEDGRHVLNLAFLTGTDLTQGLLTAENQTFTIAFRADVGGNNNSVLFAFGNNTSGGLSATRGGANGTLFFRAGNPPTAYGGFGASSVSAGYHTYVVTYDATREKPYLHYYDASATASNKPVAPIIPDNTDFKFGSRVGGVAGNEANTESGKLDTFAVWNRVLTAREVAELTAQWAMPPPSVDLTWKTGAGDWTTGLSGYAEGANVTFGANETTENVVVPADTPAAGAVTVSGDYALGAVNFGADSLEVTADGSLTLLGQPISARYVTFMPLSTGTISEFTLYLNGKEVDLEGMTIGGVDSAVNAVDGSFGTETALTQGTFIQIDAGEGKTISFDSYNVAAGADAAKFPSGWYLLAGSTQTTNPQTDTKALVSMADEEAPIAGAYLWETPRALSGSTGSNLAITDTVTVAGTVGGNGTITAKSIAFAEGATIKPTGVGYFILTANEFTGKKELALDLSALNLPVEAAPTTNVYVLITSIATDFTFTGVPAGYRVRNLGGTGYVLTKDFTQPFSAAVSGTVNWEDLVWTDADNVEIPQIIRGYLRGDMANLSLALTAADANARVYVDTAAPASLTINASEHQLTLASEGIVAFEPAALTVNGDLYVGDGALTFPAETTLNATLTYATFSRAVVSGAVTGTGSIVKTGTGTLAIAEGANVGVNIEVQAGALAPAVNTTLGADLTLADGTTLDLSAGVPLNITGTLTVPGIVDEADAPVITIALATDFVATEEPKTLVTYAALASGGLEPADIVFTGVTAENWLVDFGATAITVEALATIPLPEGVVGDETGGFSEDAQAAILGAVAEQTGVTEVTSVSLMLNGQSADTATFNDLVACVTNLPLTVTVEEGVATVEAACDLTITSIEIADGKVVVAAALTGADGETTPLTLNEGVKVELVPVTLDGTEPGAALGEATVEADGALTLPSPDATAGTVLFKVRLTPPTAQ